MQKVPSQKINVTQNVMSLFHIIISVDLQNQLHSCGYYTYFVSLDMFTVSFESLSVGSYETEF